MQASWNKYGEESFEFKALVYCARDKQVLYQHEHAVWGLYVRGGFGMFNTLAPAPTHWLGQKRPGLGQNLRDPALRKLAREAHAAWRNTDEGMAVMKRAGKRAMSRMRSTPGIEERRKAAARAATQTPEFRAGQSDHFRRLHSAGVYNAETRERGAAKTRKEVECCHTGRTWASLTACALELGVSVGQVSAACSGAKVSPPGTALRMVGDAAERRVGVQRRRAVVASDGSIYASVAAASAAAGCDSNAMKRRLISGNQTKDGRTWKYLT
jgi:hypothetical protein